MMAENWDHALDKNQHVINDLDRMMLSMYAGRYKDVNQNGILDFDVDSLISLWAYNQKKGDFDYLQYASVGDKDFIADSILNLTQLIKGPYASYGFFGEEKNHLHYIGLQ